MYASSPEKLSDLDPCSGVVGMANTLEACNNNRPKNRKEEGINPDGTINNGLYQFSTAGQTMAVLELAAIKKRKSLTRQWLKQRDN